MLKDQVINPQLVADLSNYSIQLTILLSKNASILPVKGKIVKKAGFYYPHPKLKIIFHYLPLEDLTSKTKITVLDYIYLSLVLRIQHYLTNLHYSIFNWYPFQGCIFKIILNQNEALISSMLGMWQFLIIYHIKVACQLIKERTCFRDN